MRTGKCIISLQVIGRCQRRHKISKVLIVAPKTVVPNWEVQFLTHYAQDYTFYDKNKSLEMLRNGCKHLNQYKPTIHVLAINYELLWSFRKEIADFGFDILVLDESHRIKNRKSKMSKGAAYFSCQIERVLLLTGTPVGKINLDLYSQFNIMNNKIFGPWKQFEKEWTEKHGYNRYKTRIKKKKQKEFERIIKEHAYYVSGEVLGDLKEEDYIIKVKLTGEAAKYYYKIEDRNLAYFKGKKITTDLAVTTAVKLQRLCGGFLALDNGDVVQLEQDKLIALIKLLKVFDKNEKIVIFAKFIEELNIIARMLDKRWLTYTMLHGGTKDRKTIVHDFQYNKDPKVFLAQVQTGGVGIDLYAANKCIFYSKTHNYIDIEQARARLRIKDKKEKIEFYHLVCEDSIDEDIETMLERKSTSIVHLLKQLKRRTSWLK